MRASVKANAKAKANGHEDRAMLDELCALPAAEAIARLGGSGSGLDVEEAARRLKTYGPNTVTPKSRSGIGAAIFDLVKEPLTIQLFVIALISAVIGEAKSAIMVGAMLMISMGMSLVLERRSQGAVEALGESVRSRATVSRGGSKVDIPIAEVVPGDIVQLQAGSVIPADLRLIAAKDFFVSESVLSGESLPVEKKAEPAVAAGDAGAGAGAANACFFGTSVTSGTGVGLAVLTGGRTVLGGISASLAGSRDATSFDRGLRGFTSLMIRVMVVLTATIFLVIGITKGDWIQALLFAVSVAVGLTPELLPMMVTVNLAKGALAMAKRKVIVKRLPAIQNFGAMDILCTDKTGTLTQDRVVLERHVDITGNRSDEVLDYAFLTSYYQTGLRNLIDRAVLEHASLDPDLECSLLDELPFDFQRRRMSVAVAYRGDHVLVCKGAVEEIYECCTRYQLEDEVYPLIDVVRRDLLEEVERLNREGFRVLGIAYREFPPDRRSFTMDDERDMVLLGYIAFFDPPKESARDALARLGAAGVTVKVLTGDNRLVAEKSCRDVGIGPPVTATGADVEKATDAELRTLVESHNLFVKLAPAQKERIVATLRAAGHVVGFMGDGINDAPALKAADVGISVDSAVDVAKESADIILLEKSLTILGEGIAEGRTVFRNILNYIRMGASSNFGNMFSMLGASILLPFLPMLPVQILANNLLYDFSQTGIPSDRVDPELVEKPVLWDIGGIRRFMITLGPVSSLFDYATFALMWFVFGCSSFLDPGADVAARDAAAALFRTGWFVESLVTQTMIVHVIRTRRVPIFGSRSSRTLALTTLAAIAAGVWLPFSPLAGVLGLVPLPPSFWIWLASFALAYAVMAHIVKSLYFRRHEGG